jgi:NADH:ubiquinone reductase (H+-translocating)
MDITPTTRRPHVVVIGAGFAGIHAARALRRSPVDVTVIDRRNFHLFQPLLYQVATGTLSPGEIAVPVRTILRNQRNATVILGQVDRIDPVGRRVHLDDGHGIPYDHLIVSAGARTSYFGHDDWATDAHGLKTIEDALDMRRRILLAFERAEVAEDPDERRTLLTFVVVGGGPTGVELAGQVAEMAHTTLRRDFRRIDPAQARVLLVDGAERVLPQFPEPLSAKAQRSLEKLGVTLMHGRHVVAVGPDAVVIEGRGSAEIVRTRTILWAAGVAAAPLGSALAAATSAQLDRTGRVHVEPDLTVPGHANIHVLGDLAHAVNPRTGDPLPGVAQVAIQQGRYAARAVDAAVAGRSIAPFRYRDPGAIATIGRNKAVASIHGVHLSGYPAWVLWAALHLAFLVGHLNRLVVMTRWAWNYLAQARGGRLITAYPEDAVEPPVKEARAVA